MTESPRDEIPQIVISGLYQDFVTCVAYQVVSGIFLKASTICELLGSYQEYSAKSVGKQGREFLIATNEKKK
jgi:hypothetical protein